MKKLITSFARMNPPHIGHLELISYIDKLSKELNGEPTVFLSHTENNNKNPLLYETKTLLLQKWSNGIVKFDYDNEIKQPINVLHYAHKHLFDEVYFVCGQDRFDEYTTKFADFIQSRDYFNFNKVEIILREGLTNDQNISSTRMREFVKTDNQELFFEFLPVQSTLEEKIHVWNNIKQFYSNKLK